MPGKNICLTVTVVRHAETDLNAQVPRVLQGQSDAAINPTGTKQAESLAWRLKKEEFDAIYTSDLVRAKQTSYIIAKHHPKTPLHKEPRLREQDLGDLTGLPWPTAKAILKEEDRSFDDHIAERGESNRKFKERVVGTYRDLIEEHLVEPHTKLERAVSGEELRDDSNTTTTIKNKTKPPRMRQINILLITHGGFIQRLTEHLLEDLSFTLQTPLQTGFPKPTSVTKFVITKHFKPDGDYEWAGSINLMNCVSHLAGMERREGGSKSLPGSRGGSRNASPAASPVLGRRARFLGASNSSGLATSGRMGILGDGYYQGLVHQQQQRMGNAPPAPTTRNKTLGW